MILLLCVTIWILVVCHYRLKYRIATLKQFHSMDSASVYHHARRQSSVPSTYTIPNRYNIDRQNTNTQLSLDVTHTYDYPKSNKTLQRQQSTIISEEDDIDKSDNFGDNLTVNRLFHDPSFYRQNISKTPQTHIRNNNKNKESMGGEIKRRATISAFEIDSNKKQKKRNNDQSPRSRDDSLISYIGLSKQSSKRLIPRQRSIEQSKQDSYFPFLTKQKPPINTPSADRFSINNYQFMEMPHLEKPSQSEPTKIKTRQFRPRPNIHLSVPPQSSPKKVPLRHTKSHSLSSILQNKLTTVSFLI